MKGCEICVYTYIDYFYIRLNITVPSPLSFPQDYHVYSYFSLGEECV